MNSANKIVAVERFAHEGYLSKQQLAALTQSLKDSQPIKLRSLLATGVVPELNFANAMSELYALEIVSSAELPKTALAGTDDFASFLLEHEALPIAWRGKRLKLAMTDPSDEFTLQVLRTKFSSEIEPVIVVRSELLAALHALYPNVGQASLSSANSAFDMTDVPADLESESSLVRDLHRLLQRAVTVGASDIHFEPLQQSLQVRFRVNGLMRNVYTFPADEAVQAVARLKLMARLDVTERRKAQDGRFKFPADGKIIDLRVSSVPLHDGESTVLRLLEFGLTQSSLLDLGFRAEIADAIQQTISTQQGMVLITGPTGSGKSTTLYSLLNLLNTQELKLISIEDPVELNIPGINQIQIDEEHGIGFAQSLRSVLRQDPDVIMVGEIRDGETAQLAAQAALTGHLVLCTLHTATAASAVSRLKNLGLAEYLISATLKAVVAQRLVRCLCVECQGAENRSCCSNCDRSGYVGRTIIAEFLPGEALSSGSNGSLATEVELAGETLSGISLENDAQHLVSTDRTDQTEVFRVLGGPLVNNH